MQKGKGSIMDSGGIAMDPGSSQVVCFEEETATLVFFLPPRKNGETYNYTISRDGFPLDPSDKVRLSERPGATTGSEVHLTLQAVRQGDAGRYTLSAHSAATADVQARAAAELKVLKKAVQEGENPPQLLRRLTDIAVKVGTRTRLVVELKDSNDVTVTWFHNDIRQLESERFRLVNEGLLYCLDVAPVMQQDAGYWTCMAENTSGRSSTSCNLNVLVPKAYKKPEFIEELKALLTEFGTVSLECKVVGVPTPVLRWFKDSKEIKAGDIFALTANPEDPTSLGTYTCEAVNCMGRTYSSSKVHVVGKGSREGSLKPADSMSGVGPPPIFTRELQGVNVKIGDSFSLLCQVMVPPWPKVISWYNSAGRIDPDEPESRYKFIEDPSKGSIGIEIMSAQKKDSGEWKCVATSRDESVSISNCRVVMDIPKNYRAPRFMESLKAVLTEEGLVSFECKVVGFPSPVLRWFKDGVELKPGDVYQLTGTNSLGSYCCIARNCMGEASSTAELTIEDIQSQLNDEEKMHLFSWNQTPKFIQGLKSCEAKINESFKFSVQVNLIAEPILSWYRDDFPIEHSDRYKIVREKTGYCHLEVQYLEFVDQAEWKCVAMNDFGHSVTSCFLKLIIPRHFKKPKFLEALRAVLSEEGAVNLECKVIGVPQPILKWYKDGEELKPGDIHKIITGQDGTCCLGTYTCEARNCMGIAASSASLLGYENAQKQEQQLQEIALQKNTSLSTIHEERTSQMYDTPAGDITLDERGDVSFSFDGKEVSVSLYETPDLTEEEALQIIEMYADQLSENVTEHNVVELPNLRFMKETSTTGNLLMEAIVIDVTSPNSLGVAEYEDLRTEIDVEDLSSMADSNMLMSPTEEKSMSDADMQRLTNEYLKQMNEKLSGESIPKRPPRKSDSQKTGDEFFSVSSPKDKNTFNETSDTEPLTFASAKSSEDKRKAGVIDVDILNIDKADIELRIDEAIRETVALFEADANLTLNEIKEDMNVEDENTPLRDLSGEEGDGLVFASVQNETTEELYQFSESDLNLLESYLDVVVVYMREIALRE